MELLLFLITINIITADRQNECATSRYIRETFRPHTQIRRSFDCLLRSRRQSFGSRAQRNFVLNRKL